MTESEVPARRGRNGWSVGCTGALALAVAGIAWLAYASVDSTYPDVDPEKRARQLSGYSQDTYAALGIDRTVRGAYVDVDVNDNNDFGHDDCYPDGLFSIADPPVEGAYRLYQEWTLSKVHKAEALPGLRGVRHHLKAKGWHITESGKDEQIEEWSVRAERDGGYQIHVIWEAEYHRLTGFVRAPCAMDPDWPEEKRKEEEEQGYSGPYDGPTLDFPPALTPARTPGGR
ncbi:hypothetical protein VT50_0230020 [Streptomyces antioxidans]|uniref:Uncharacterized protein n=1 Tax=Streptomyces antioxidans TaxID=1507734 RepID=A0A1V4CXC7_9ACTN|nr:hypothetical protein [Streptomyces antioxidans]OPF72852.1 hypothetical protein VT50_0230020 [Streptomyces antioxidans]